MAQPSDSEWRTRKRLIDPRLQAAGWRVTKYDPAHPVGTGAPVPIEEFPTDNGPADYPLCADSTMLGVIEANTVTQGFLAKAFRGELVPAEADLAHAEGRPYQPASALLARIGSFLNVEPIVWHKATPACDCRNGRCET